MIALDTLVVTTALPVLRADLHTSIGSPEQGRRDHRLLGAPLPEHECPDERAPTIKAASTSALAQPAE